MGVDIVSRIGTPAPPSITARSWFMRSIVNPITLPDRLPGWGGLLFWWIAQSALLILGKACFLYATVLVIRAWWIPELPPLRFWVAAVIVTIVSQIVKSRRPLPEPESWKNPDRG